MMLMTMGSQVCFLSSLNRIEPCLWKQSFNRLYLLTGKTYASVVAAAASKDGEAVSSDKEFASSTEAVSGDSDKGIVGGADKEEKSSLEVGADEKVSDEAGSPDTASLLSPEPEAVSEKTTEENKKVTEGVDDVEDNEQSGLFSSSSSFISSFSRIESCLWK